jgi:virginiamycin B lyase
LSGKSRASSSSNKKLIIYAAIGILAVAAIAITLIPRGAGPEVQSGGSLAEDSRQRSIARFEEQLCGNDARANSNAHITEYVLPSDCEIPLGIAVEGDTVWYVSTKQGTLGSYNSADGNFEEFPVPSWPARSDPTGISQVFAVRLDDSGENVWFTDDKSNLLWRFNKSSGTFDKFISPAVGPISFDFDANGNIYLVGVRSNSIFFGELAKMKPDTQEGFTEIKLPLDAFAQIRDNAINSGSITVDRERNVVWTTILSYQTIGQIFQYDVATKEVTVTDLPEGLTSPVGTVLDGEGNLWLTDHGTSVFFMLDASDGTITRYVTSIPSSRIFGGQTPDNAVSWPYWLQSDDDGSIWFNQHAGNKIARFDPQTQTLVEYWIPSQNENWGNCPEGSATCGIANAVQFAVGADGQAWFTEWSENKIGTVKNPEPPFSISAPEEVTVERGESAEVEVDVSSQDGFTGRTIAAGTFTHTGSLGNSTGIFSQQSVEVGAGGTEQLSYVFTPADDLAEGQYMLMVGAENDDVAVLKAVRVNVT